MRRKGFSKNRHSWLAKRVIWAALFLMLAFFISGFTKKTTKNNEIKGEIEKLKEEISQYEQKNQELNSLIQYFSTDDFVEEEARTKLGLKKPGEHVVVITESEEKNERPKKQVELAKVPRSNTESWWIYFFGE